MSLARPLLALSWFLAIGATGLAQVSQPPPAPQDVRDEITRLRGELDTLRRTYEARLASLEARLAASEQSSVQAVAAVPPGAAGAGGPEGTLPVYGNVTALSKIFNPDIAAVGNFLAAAGHNPEESLPAFDLQEVETSLQAVVDPYARADFFLAFGPEGVDLEEAFITFPTLPAGLLMKAGKLRNAFGKVNTLHSHVLPWADRPLVTTNLLGGEEGLSGAGISLARLLPNPWIFLEATGEVSHSDSELFRSQDSKALTYFGRVRAYQDMTESSNVDIGASVAYGSNGATPDSTTSVFGLDATFRYRPLKRAHYHRLLARTELVWSRRTEIGGPAAFGAYVATDYQFARRWFAGVRLDHAARTTDPMASDSGVAGLLTFWPSEFSQVRSQYRRTKYSEGAVANEVLVQLLFSIGAHGAHAF